MYSMLQECRSTYRIRLEICRIVENITHNAKYMRKDGASVWLETRMILERCSNKDRNWHEIQTWSPGGATVNTKSTIKAKIKPN